MMGDKTWRDGVDIDPPTFYELLRTSPDFPTSSQPSVATFQDLFVKLSKEVEGIVVIVLSEELSGTIDSARAAAANLPDIPIEIIDSRGCSMVTGYPVLAAAKAAAAGEDLQTVANAARALVGRIVCTSSWTRWSTFIGAAGLARQPNCLARPWTSNQFCKFGTAR